MILSRTFRERRAQRTAQDGAWILARMWSDWKTSDISWIEGVWIKKWKKLEGEETEFIKKEKREGVIDEEVNGKVNSVYQENTWDEDEESAQPQSRRKSFLIPHGEATRTEAIRAREQM